MLKEKLSLYIMYMFPSSLVDFFFSLLFMWIYACSLVSVIRRKRGGGKKPREEQGRCVIRSITPAGESTDKYMYFFLFSALEVDML